MKINIETIKSEYENQPSFVKVTDDEGKELKGILAMTIQMQPNMPVVAYVDMQITPEKIQAEAILSIPSLFEAADFYGFSLVRKEVIN